MNSAHFTLAEFGASGAPADVQANLATITFPRLEAFRAVLGAPMVTTSGYRSPAHNVAVGGSNTSDHVNGLAWDGYVTGHGLPAVWTAWRAADRAGLLPPFDQAIFYPFTTGHIHLGFGSRQRRQWLLALSEGGYSGPTVGLLERAGFTDPGPVANAAAGFAALLLAFLFLRARKGTA